MTEAQESSGPSLKRRTLLTGAAAAALALPAAVRANSAREWQEETDVVVVGGGAAGCVAASTARDAGAQVILCEKAGFLGGTSAKSGGGYWIPNNFDLQARGVADPKEDFLKFTIKYSYPAAYDPQHRTLGVPENTFALIGAYYDHANAMVEHMASIGALQSAPFPIPTANGVTYYPDYLEHIAENVTPRGRLLVPKRADGVLSAGDELMSQLSQHVQRSGVKVMLDSPVVDIVQDEAGAVIGVVVTSGTGTRAIRARRGVIFGSGGYSQNPDLVRDFQPFPIFGRCALPGCTGDFVRLGARAGARLGNMTGAWRAQCVVEHALEYQSLPMDVFWTIGDSVFVVNKYGQRCFNEKRNYQDRTRQCYVWDATRAEYPNLLTFPIYDRRTAELFAGNYPLPDVPADDACVISADTLEGLAAALDERLAKLASHTGGVRLDASFQENLKESFGRFNRYAREGRDPEFHRGLNPYDVESHLADQIQQAGTQWPPNPYPCPAMHPLLESGPYYTMVLGPGVMDTNGGPVIGPTAAVLDSAGKAIAGLYGAGNCIASPAADAYWGPGATLGPAMTFGYIAGKSAASRRPA